MGLRGSQKRPMRDRASSRGHHGWAPTMFLPGCSRAVTPIDPQLLPTQHDMFWRRPGGAPKTPVPGDRTRHLWTPPRFASRDIVDMTNGGSSWECGGAVSPVSTFSKSTRRSPSPGMRTFESCATRLKSPDTAREISAMRTKTLFPKRVHLTKRDIRISRECIDHAAQMQEISAFDWRISRKETDQFAEWLKDPDVKYDE